MTFMKYLSYWPFSKCRKPNASYLRFKDMNDYIQYKIDIEYYLKNIHTVEALKDIILYKEQCKVFEIMRKHNINNRLEDYRNRNKPGYEAGIRQDVLKYYKEKNEKMTDIDIKLMCYVDDGFDRTIFK